MFGTEKMKEEWTRTAMITWGAINSNPYLKKPVSAAALNPFADPEPVKRISLAEAMKDF